MLGDKEKWRSEWFARVIDDDIKSHFSKAFSPEETLRRRWETRKRGGEIKNDTCTAASSDTK